MQIQDLIGIDVGVLTASFAISGSNGHRRTILAIGGRRLWPPAARSRPAAWSFIRRRETWCVEILFTDKQEEYGYEMDRTTTMVVTPDGRELCVEFGGDPDGRAILGFQGSPSGRRMMDEWLDGARMDGVLLIGYDRPGYGDSTSHPGRTVRDCASDVRAIASALGVQRLAVWGVSGGAPHALACAALLDGLVCGCVVFSSLAPFEEHGLDWFDDMGGDLVADAQLALESPEAAREAWKKFRVDLLDLSSEQIELRAQKLPTADMAAISYFRWLLATNFKDAFAPGIEGKWEDGCAYLSPWEIDLEAIRVPVRLWHGMSDDVVPMQHSLWLDGRIPTSELHLARGEGHLSVFINHLVESQTWLLEQF